MESVEKHLLRREISHLGNKLPFSAKKTGSERLMISNSGQSALKVTSFLNVHASPQRKILNQEGPQGISWQIITSSGNWKFTVWFLSKVKMNSEGFTLDPSQNLLQSSVANQGAPKPAILKRKARAATETPRKTWWGECWGLGEDELLG